MFIKRKAPGSISYAVAAGINFGFAVYSLICLLPIALVIIISLTDEGSIIKYGYSFIPKTMTLNAYKFVLSDSKAVFGAFGVSGIVTLCGTILGCLFTAMYAYPLARRDFSYRNHFAFFVAFTMLFNGGLVPWYITYAKILMIKDTYLVLMMPLLVNGFNVMILRTFMIHNIPQELIESAKLDGASEFRTFFQIVIPLALPGLATVALFLSLSYWNDWYNALLFIDNKKMFPLQYLMYQVNRSIDVLNTNTFMSDSAKAGFVRPSESARMAMGVIGIGPIIFAYPFLQKYFVKGLTIGSVKG